MKKFNTLLCALFISSQIFCQTISTFENLTLASDTFWDGSDLSGGFGSGNAYFVNDYNTSFFSWSGFTYSNMQDSTTPGYDNQYSAITAGGYSGSSNYAIADEYGNAKILLTGNAAGKPVKGFFVTNTTYAYLSMKDGDAFAKKFGGATGADPDWFRLRALGWHNGALKAQAVDFYLADFRSADSMQDYIVRDWRWLDLQSLGDVDSILFSLSSSDTAFGYMNTPAYFAMDNFATSDQQNDPPIAVNDYVVTNYLNDTSIAVLANDFDTTAPPLTVELIGLPLIPGARDTVINNQILYTPAIGIVATDTLVYKLCDATLTCVTAKVVVKVVGVTAVAEINASDLPFTVYPNPSNGDFTITNLPISITDPVQVAVFNLEGRQVVSEEVASSSYKLLASQWDAGVYFIRLRTAESLGIKKVIRQ
jgi:hypothetical protein